MNIEGRMLMVIVGPSGVGKDTVARTAFRAMGIPELISHTTREQREGEVDGKHYYFDTKNTFEKMRLEARFVECATVHDHQYGVTAKELDDKMQPVGYVVTDIQGAETYKKRLGNRAVVVFIYPPDAKSLVERAIKRGTKNLSTRLGNAKLELEISTTLADFFIINDDVEIAIHQLRDITKICVDHRMSKDRMYKFAYGIWENL